MQLPATHGSWLLNVGFSNMLAFEIKMLWGFLCFKMGSIFVMFSDYFLKKWTDAFESPSVNMFSSPGFLYNSYIVS